MTLWNLNQFIEYSGRISKILLFQIYRFYLFEILANFFIIKTFKNYC